MLRLVPGLLGRSASVPDSVGERKSGKDGARRPPAFRILTSFTWCPWHPDFQSPVQLCCQPAARLPRVCTLHLTQGSQMEFRIAHTWDGFPVKHEPACVRLHPHSAGVMLEVSAPLFNDPPAPVGPPGEPFGGLWDYEVVEAFFLNHMTEQYLEVELCPHGQHLVLLLSGRRKVWKQELPLHFQVSRRASEWEGKAYLPWSYFPPGVTKFNSFAIHGSADERSYESLYPVPWQELRPGQAADFHRLEYFRPLRFQELLGEAWTQPESDLWPAE